ncbi:MAG: sugar transferase [Chlorobiales bacterium]|nr:sugar transferase [Chlorobiales bacterium]
MSLNNRSFHTRSSEGLTLSQAFGKRLFDICGAAGGLVLTFWVILLAFAVVSIDTRSNGFFVQQRVGRRGKLFRIIKIRTMRNGKETGKTVTTIEDARITTLGKFLRKTKIDELPQLINVLKGEMSFVGPRPDVPGFADCLEGDDRLVLAVRPGITGPATLKYRDEELLLSETEDPEQYNRKVVFPDKVRINREYVKNWSFSRDMKYLWETFF